MIPRHPDKISHQNHRWPVVASIIALHPPHLLSAILDELLLKPHANPIGRYSPIVVVVIGGVMYFIIAYDLKNRPRRTHGSARHARGKEGLLPLVGTGSGKKKQDSWASP